MQLSCIVYLYYNNLSCSLNCIENRIHCIVKCHVKEYVTVQLKKPATIQRLMSSHMELMFYDNCYSKLTPSLQTSQHIKQFINDSEVLQLFLIFACHVNDTHFMLLLYTYLVYIL